MNDEPPLRIPAVCSLPSRVRLGQRSAGETVKNEFTDEEREEMM